MLVDVVCLRRNGNKLASDAVKAAVPVRGRIIIRTEPWREHWQPNITHVPTTFAYLKNPLRDDPLVESLLPALRMAHVKTLVEDAFVVIGLPTFAEADSSAPFPWRASISQGVCYVPSPRKCCAAGAARAARQIAEPRIRASRRLSAIPAWWANRSRKRSRRERRAGSRLPLQVAQPPPRQRALLHV